MSERWTAVRLALGGTLPASPLGSFSAWCSELPFHRRFIRSNSRATNSSPAHMSSSEREASWSVKRAPAPVAAGHWAEHLGNAQTLGSFRDGTKGPAIRTLRRGVWEMGWGPGHPGLQVGGPVGAEPDKPRVTRTAILGHTYCVSGNPGPHLLCAGHRSEPLTGVSTPSPHSSPCYKFVAVLGAEGEISPRSHHGEWCRWDFNPDPSASRARQAEGQSLLSRAVPSNLLSIT